MFKVNNRDTRTTPMASKVLSEYSSHSKINEASIVRCASTLIIFSRSINVVFSKAIASKHCLLVMIKKWKEVPDKGRFD